MTPQQQQQQQPQTAAARSTAAAATTYRFLPQRAQLLPSRLGLVRRHPRSLRTGHVSQRQRHFQQRLAFRQRLLVRRRSTGLEQLPDFQRPRRAPMQPSRSQATTAAAPSASPSVAPAAAAATATPGGCCSTGQRAQEAWTQAQEPDRCHPVPTAPAAASGKAAAACSRTTTG